MLNQKRLILAIQEDLAECRKQGRGLDDIQALERRKLEVAALLRHLQMAEEAGDDQVELQRVVKSCEANPVLKAYQYRRQNAKA